MAALEEVSEQRKEWMMDTILDKISEKGGSMQVKIKCLLSKFDRDKSGELDMDEFRDAIEEFLHGTSDAELGALAAKFDADGSGAVSVKEFTEALSARAAEREETGGRRPRPGANLQGVAKVARRPRPEACGMPRRSGEHEAATRAMDEERVRAFFDQLRLRARKMANVAGAVDAFKQKARHEPLLEDKLLRRACERHRSTVKARHLDARQFLAAMAHFDVDDGAAKG